MDDINELHERDFAMALVADIVEAGLGHYPTDRVELNTVIANDGSDHYLEVYMNDDPDSHEIVVFVNGDFDAIYNIENRGWEDLFNGTVLDVMNV